MSDANWQKQQHEQEEWEALLKADPEYATWLDKLNRINNGWNNTQNTTNRRKQKCQI